MLLGALRHFFRIECSRIYLVALRPSRVRGENRKIALRLGEFHFKSFRDPSHTHQIFDDLGGNVARIAAPQLDYRVIWKFSVHILLKPGLENFEHYFTSM